MRTELGYAKGNSIIRRKFDHEKGVPNGKVSSIINEKEVCLWKKKFSYKKSFIMRREFEYAKGSSIIRRKFDYEKGVPTQKIVSSLMGRKFDYGKRSSIVRKNRL